MGPSTTRQIPPRIHHDAPPEGLTPPAPRITKHYMADYTPSRVVSLRIDAALLEELRERARTDGRSLSGEILFFVRERVDLERDRATRGKPRPLTGWLSRRDTPQDLAIFREGRAKASAALTGAVRKKARRR